MNKTRFLILFLTAALLAVVIALPAGAQSSCQPGQYDDGSGSGCVDAPPGSFVPLPGATGAIFCAPGTYQDLAGQTSCKLADAGFYVPVAGSIAQTACASATTSLAGATACEPIGVVQNPGNGNYYELVTTGLKWDDARAAAEARTYLNCTGHLATITSLAEDTFVQDTFAGRFWLGGFQDPEDTLQSDANWAWVTGEVWSYTGWKSGEPNDFPIPNSGLEQALQMDQFLNGNRGWIDDARKDGVYIDPYTNLSRTRWAPLDIYLVEYEGPCEADDHPPVADTGGPYLTGLGTATEFDGTGSTDPDGDAFAYAWHFGDGTPDGSGATPAHSYAAAGVYDVCLTVSNAGGASENCTMAVVYDPTAGFVTGGGWFESPAGAYTVDPSAAGKATFGFVAKYKKGATTPDGNTQFQFKAGDLNFQSTSYEWLVVAGANAKYKGKGTINGVGEYGFMITANDSAIAGGGTDDSFRIKIWDAGETVIYDNQMGAGEDSAAATALGGGSIVIHSGR